MFSRRPSKDDAASDQQHDLTGQEARRVAPRSPGEAIKPAIAPPPPPRIRRPRGGLLSTLSGLFSFFALICMIAVIGLVLVARQAAAPGPLDQDQVVVIPRNTGTAGIADILAREGVIDQPLLFQIATVISGQRGNLKAGEFAFRANTSMNEAMEIMAQGRSLLHSVTIPEGLTSYQIVNLLNENEILDDKITEVPEEGSLMPDTYRFERGTSRRQIIQVMQRAQTRELARIWERRADDLPLETAEELVVLASIVEKETGRADERPRVAGVFINRLNQGMRLQSDPTIVYGLVGGEGTLGRGIRRSEIQAETPYNTYVISGLPPGPIANPGRAAMEAVANPSRTDELFFVADGTGGHTFSRTYDQHRRAVTRWREIENERREQQIDRVDETEEALDQQGNLESRPRPASPVSVDDPAFANVRDPGRVGLSVDVSEGTPLDPLAFTGFDLNAPQTVPELPPPPGEEGAISDSTSPDTTPVTILPPPRPATL